jgi:signal transduction histidine kinase
MRFFRRSLVALGVAATLPTLLFAGIGVSYLLRSERQQVESAVLMRCATIMNLGDALVRGNLSALQVFSTSVYFDTGDWREFHRRLRQMLSGSPQLSTLRLFDVQSGEEIFDLREPFGAPRPMSLPERLDLDAMRRSGEPVIGNILVDREPVMYLYQPVRTQGELRYVLAAAMRAQAFQDLLTTQMRPGATAAIVDRNGNFVARTRNYAQRVATPVTPYVRDAIRGGKQGFYRGTTYEGLQNYTAFDTSAWSGLSVHIAIASTLIDRPVSWSFAAVGVAGLGCIGLGAILVLLVLRDMAERRRAEEALRQSQKMEAVGQLTGGIAHDFNNLLTAVIGNLDMIRSRTGDNARLRQLADNALEAAQRGAKLTSQLLAFSRSQRMKLETVDLQRLLGGMSTLLQQSAGASVIVRVDVADEARFVTSDQNQLELALLNLAVNARDAMPRGGVLTISTHVAGGALLQDLPQKPYVEVRVADTGEGMTEAVRSRAVEPFFTTKQVGQGTGLGLSQVYGVTRESGGLLHIDSLVGAGTIVRLLLPASAPIAAAATTAIEPGTSSPPPAAAGVRHSILIVDDDRQVRRFMALSLRDRGYDVIDADSGALALEHLGTRRFDLLLVDFAMPGMNGAQVAQAARAMQRDLKVLLVSGYADSAAVESALGASQLLRKPFDAGELEAAVAKALS